MIPIAIVVGLAIGRWWALAVAAIGWAGLLVAMGVTGFAEAITLGAFLALVNAAIGVAVHKAIATLVRTMRASSLG